MTAEQLIERAVGDLFRGLYQLQQAGDYQTSFDRAGTVAHMLTSHRLELLKQGKAKP
jgi:hypothetical protein